MLRWPLMNSGYNGEIKSDIYENRFSTLRWRWHLRWRIDQCSETRHQPDPKSRLVWCSSGSWWILVTIVNSNQIFEKIDFRLRWRWHLRQRIDQCSEPRHQPETISRLFWCPGSPWWILVTMVNSNEIFEKIEFRPPIEVICSRKIRIVPTCPGRYRSSK